MARESPRHLPRHTARQDGPGRACRRAERAPSARLGARGRRPAARRPECAQWAAAGAFRPREGVWPGEGQEWCADRQKPPGAPKGRSSRGVETAAQGATKGVARKPRRREMSSTFCNGQAVAFLFAMSPQALRWAGRWALRRARVRAPREAEVWPCGGPDLSLNGRLGAWPRARLGAPSLSAGLEVSGLSEGWELGLSMRHQRSSSPVWTSVRARAWRARAPRARRVRPGGGPNCGTSMGRSAALRGAGVCPFVAG